MRKYSFFLATALLFVGCATKQKNEELKGLPFKPPAWAEEGAIADNNLSAVGISEAKTGVVFNAIDSTSNAREKLKKKVEVRIYPLLYKALGSLTNEQGDDAVFLSAKVSSEAVISFYRDEIWFSPMGDMYQLYSIDRDNLAKILGDSFVSFVKSNERYSDIKDSAKIDEAKEQMISEL